MNALGLSARKLKGAVIDKTKALPDLTTTRTKPLTPSHVVVVIEENHDQNQIVGSANAPYINNTLIKGGLYYANAHGTDHDSQPNYLELFSGANPGVQGINSPLQATWPNGVDDTNPAVLTRENNSDDYNADQPFSIPNLGAELLAKGLTFTGYSETLPECRLHRRSIPARPGTPQLCRETQSLGAVPGHRREPATGGHQSTIDCFPDRFLQASERLVRRSQ